MRALGVSTAVSGLIVVLSFRRSFWLLLASGIAIVVWRSISLRKWNSNRALLASVGIVVGLGMAVASFGGQALAERLESLNPLSENDLAVSNADHLGDIADAWSVVSANPVVGLGIGTYYQTKRISGWKLTSFEVHNAFLNAWLKFGLLGLITYIGFHFRWIVGLFRSGRSSFIGIVGAGVYLLAEQVPSLIQTWPYNSFQISVHHGILLAVCLLGVAELHHEQDVAFPSNHARKIQTPA
jgi:O-antigen ligase